jgi:hypothetical protein
MRRETSTSTGLFHIFDSLRAKPRAHVAVDFSVEGVLTCPPI